MRPGTLAEVLPPRLKAIKDQSLFATGFMLAVALWLAGCSHPIGAQRVSGRASYQQLERSALDGSHCSSDTEVVLHRYDLTKQFAQHPAEALRILHQQALIDDRRDLLFALAELNFLQAEHLQRSVRHSEPRQTPDYFLSSAIYAYLFLLGEGREPPPGAFDRRFRVACDLYNRAVAQGFATVSATNRVVRMASGFRELPPGRVEVKFSKDRFKWTLDEMDVFLPADEFALRGLSVRDRRAGLGSPLIVAGKILDPKRYPRRFPATLFLRVTGNLRAWSEGRLSVSLELFSTHEQRTVNVGGHEIPLEADTTAPLAYAMNDTLIWKLAMAQFFSSEERIRSSIYFSQPYVRGLIPVVFVHGTVSSPIWWAEMWNTLRTDAVLRDRFQFWFFSYNTGNPVTFSANRLRAELTRKVRQLDPEGKDPALRHMVVIGHSQGGLLTKLTVTETGDRLWHTVSTNDLSALHVSPELSRALRTNFFFSPLPFVQRVVFVATPHRGTSLATSFRGKVVRMFMSVSRKLLAASGHWVPPGEQVEVNQAIRNDVPTSLDGMSPKNKWLLELAEIPPAAGVKAHSIVALKGNDQPPNGGDGVVTYTSAHVPYVESELVVRSDHSCQNKPATIEEVRRILLCHLKETKLSPGP